METQVSSSRTIRALPWAAGAAVAVPVLAGLAYALVRQRTPRSDGFPQDPALDSTIDLLREGYTFIQSRAQRLGTDAFATRLEGRDVICVTGEEAACMFFVPGRFSRRGAIPVSALRLLQDTGSVQTLDGRWHDERKALFLSLMTPERIADLTAMMREEWRAAVLRWEQMETIVLHHELRLVLCRAICRWTGIPLPEADVKQRTAEFASMIDGAGTIGPRNWWATLRRHSTERWIQDLIRGIRSGRVHASESTPVSRIAQFRRTDGRRLTSETAAVELINILRPTIAVAGFIAFEARALHEHPDARGFVESGGDRALDAFCQEVRRYYPFFPVIGGRVREPFEWRGHAFRPGTWVLMDVYGTNHDPRVWPDPDAFRPERFARGEPTPFNMIPQGGGDLHQGHRCAGEPLTLALMKTAATLLTADMRYDVPPQDLELDLTRIPALPYEFVISNVRRRAAAG